MRLIIESKDQSGDILHHYAEYECDRTERKMAMMTDKAFSVFSMSAKVSPVSSAASLIIAKAKVPPNNSKTIDTVVEVGNPKN